MRKVLAICFLCVMVAAIAGCSLLADNGGTVAKGTAEAVPTEKKPLVIYFAYSENMGDTSNMDVDAITSATISSRAFLDAVNRAYGVFRQVSGQLSAAPVAEAAPADTTGVVTKN